MAANGDDSDNVGLFFVIPLNLEEDDCDDDMKEAFKTSVDNEFEPTWMNEESCLKLSPSKRNVFVFQKFEGSAFDHLKKFKCVLTGPRCLNHCLLEKGLMPLVSHPTFTAAMKGLVITCSGGGAELKSKLKEKIELMAGIYSKTLNEKTTHVVVTCAASSKYERAFKLGIPVRTVEWVDAVWRKSLKEYISATDDQFKSFKCPSFLNLNVCSSGLNIKETERIKNTVIKYGGKYDSSLSKTINILVVKHGKGDKFKYAQSWSIPCVETRWIDDSVQTGHALPTKPFEVQGGRAASSPTSKDNVSVSFSANESAIPFDGRSHIDETAMNCSTLSTASYCPAAQSRTPVKMAPPVSKRTPVKTPAKVEPCVNPGELKHLLSELSLAHCKKAGLFLDGCGVFLLGWHQDEEEKLRKILKCSGAARFTDLSDRVSHILVGNLEKPFLRTIKALSHRPHVVNIKWLIQSVDGKCPAVEDPFYCLPSDNLNVTEAPSPLSKKGMALLQQKNFSPQKPLILKNHPVEVKSPNKGKQLLEKYKSSDSSELSTSGISMPPPPVPPLKSTASPLKKESTSFTYNESGYSQEEIFAGLNFVIVGLSDESARYVENDLIQKYGGKVVPKSFKGVPDYAIVPLTGATLHQTATEIINTLWLDSCIEEQTRLPVAYYHQPVVTDLKKRPLENCVLGLSGFSGVERNFIVELASALGATCQDVFAKRSKGFAKASTHLICKTSEKSEKFNAAIKWFRPAVFHSWLTECASSGTKVPESEHLVDPDQLIKPIENINSTTASISDNSVLQKCEPGQLAALRQIPGFKTPERAPTLYDEAEVQRILDLKPLPNPHDVATPPIPLGVSENPSRSESKRLQKWVNQFPDQPTPPQPRRDSTPFHVLRRRILEHQSVTSPQMLGLEPVGIPHWKDDDISDSKSSLKNQEDETMGKSGESNATCSTPTLSCGPNASRKLFEIAAVDLGSPIDGPLDKLKKLIATPEVSEEGSSNKPSSLNQPRALPKTENLRMYDSLKDGSQPYAIKWEDPVNLKRSKDGSDLLESEPGRKPQRTAEEEKNPPKRKSSECAENAPESKKPHVEAVQRPLESNNPNVYNICWSLTGPKEPHASIIRKLGGTLIDSLTFKPNCTHFIVEKSLQRSERLLAVIAAGKWILHLSFLAESDKVGKFVNEEDFEWGNPKNNLMANFKPKTVEEALAKAAYRWRTTLAERKSSGAFEGLKCKIFAAPEKASAFGRLVNAGGGTVIEISSTESPSVCLVHGSHPEVLKDYAKQGVPCVAATFLYEYLTNHPPPKPESRVLDEYRKLRQQYIAGT